MIHISKEQFIAFCNSIDEWQYVQRSVLSKYSQAFLFRLKLANALSFDKLACLFGCSKSTVSKIFWNLVQQIHQTSLAIPKISIDNSNPQLLEDLFQQMYDTLDPFYRELFEAFEDPKGKQKKLCQKKYPYWKKLLKQYKKFCRI